MRLSTCKQSLTAFLLSGKSCLVCIYMVNKCFQPSAGLEYRLIEVKHSTQMSNKTHFCVRVLWLLSLVHDFISIDVRSVHCKKELPYLKLTFRAKQNCTFMILVREKSEYKRLIE